MKNQTLYKLGVLGSILSFLPFFGFIPFLVKVCGCQIGGAMQLTKGFEQNMTSFVRGG